MSDSGNEGERSSAAQTKRPRLISSWLIQALIVVFIVALLMAILSPAVNRSPHGARRSACKNNLQQVGLAAMQYMQEYDEHLPPLTNGQQANGKTRSWRSALQPFIKNVDLWKCPENPVAKSDTLALDGLPLGYDVVLGGIVRNSKPLELSAIESPFSTILIFEKNGDNAEAQQIGALWDKDDGDENWTNILYAGHLGGTNCLFVDGHVKFMLPMTTIAGKVNRWNINNKAPVSPRALQKLKAAQHTFG